MSVCVYSVFVLSCVQVAALPWADPPSKEFYRLCIPICGSTALENFGRSFSFLIYAQ
jgi:hypothetical protein